MSQHQSWCPLPLVVSLGQHGDLAHYEFIRPNRPLPLNNKTFIHLQMPKLIPHYVNSGLEGLNSPTHQHPYSPSAGSIGCFGRSEGHFLQEVSHLPEFYLLATKNHLPLPPVSEGEELLPMMAPPSLALQRQFFSAVLSPLH